MTAYQIAGRFTLTVTRNKGTVIATTTQGAEQKLTREQAVKIIRKARKENTITKG